MSSQVKSLSNQDPLIWLLVFHLPPQVGSAENCCELLFQCSLTLKMQPHLLPSDQATGYSQDEWSNGLIRYGSRFVPSSRCISHFGKVFEKSIRGLSVGIIYNKAMSQHVISTTCPIWPPQPMVSVYLWEALEEENRNTKSNQYLYVRLADNKSASALVLYSCMFVCSRVTAKAPSMW